ncbi:unnamed protein product [Mycena citricolor]|uniref:DNA replication/recombination mediator RecO N-terminal domain-containing protein n=1 Tax=Mycena citricolor TaxID=2018698 RepID=A0AAD2HEK5_9AGAR|nr:unnamed protein product [Mycena citricolor]
MALPPVDMFVDMMKRVVKANERFVPPYGTGASLYILPVLFGTGPQVGVKPAGEYLLIVFVTPDIRACCIWMQRKSTSTNARANFFGIRDGVYITPKSHSVLPSITNMSLMTLAAEMGLKVEQRPVDYDELGTFDEAGSCGTAAVLSPIGSIYDPLTGHTFVYNDGKPANGAKSCTTDCERSSMPRNPIRTDGWLRFFNPGTMTEKELAAELKGIFTKGFAGRYGRLIAEHDLFGDALSLGLDSDPSVAFHASYALERAFFIAPEAFERHIGHFVRNYLAIVKSERVPSLFEDDGVAARPEADRTDRQSAPTDRRNDVRPADRPVGASGRKSVVDGDTRHPVGRIAVVEEQLYDTICWLMRDDGPALRNRGAKICPPHPASITSIMAKKLTVALIYDFDGTLSPGNMQEYDFIPAIGKSNREFWEESNETAREQDGDPILAYMYRMLHEAKSSGISLRRESFARSGQNIELYEGVREWFPRINAYAAERGIQLQHYINSSGLREMIEGTPIAKEFRKIYACSFLYDIDGVAYWPAVAVNYTNKTQFIFKINKGIESVYDSRRINEYIEEEQRPVQFRHMIYFGDGTTDIPCMKLVKQQGDIRSPYICAADYSPDKEIDCLVRTIIDKIEADHKLSKFYKNGYQLVTPCDLGITEDIPEEQPTLEGNAFQKARYLYDRTGLDCFADDTGLEVDALGGAPGADRKARFRTVIALIFGGKEYQFDGVVDGTITDAARRGRIRLRSGFRSGRLRRHVRGDGFRSQKRDQSPRPRRRKIGGVSFGSEIMRTYKARGVVLHTIKYGDSSMVAYLFTDLFGRMNYMIQGVHSSRGRGNKAALFQPMFLVEFEGIEQPQARMHRMKEVRSLTPLSSLPFDVRKSTISLFMAEVLYRLIRESEANEPLFDFVCRSVVQLDRMTEGISNFHLWFLVQLSAYLGFYPGNEPIPNGYFDIRAACLRRPFRRIGSAWTLPVPACSAI